MAKDPLSQRPTAEVRLIPMLVLRVSSLLPNDRTSLNVRLSARFGSLARPNISIRENGCVFDTIYMCRNRPVDEFWNSRAEGFATSP